MSDYSLQEKIDSILLSALYEDIGVEDVTTAAIFQSDEWAEGNFIAKDEGIVAGIEVAERAFHLVDPGIHFDKFLPDGARVKKGDLIAKVAGNTAVILTVERTALNFMQRMSGIATMTRNYMRKIAGTKTKILDTRKTAPGLRYFDKQAVKLGGGQNHRIGLFDLFLIKDNHIQSAGSLSEAVARCIAYRDLKYPGYKIEVEVDTLEQLREALQFPVDIIMLDNFSLPDLKTAVEVIGGKTLTEASGGVNLETVHDIALTGVDFISVGALTHSVKALDISLDLTRE